MKLAIMATGGIDSTTLAYMAKRDGVNPTLLYAWYGQSVREIESNLVVHHAAELNLEMHPVYYRYQEPITPLTDPDFKPTVTHDQEDPGYYTTESMLYHDTHIEGRNAIMVANVLAWCSLNKVDELWAGYKFTKLDWDNRRSYKLATSDNGPDFVDAMNIVAKYGYSHPIRFRAPFMESRWDKRRVVAEAETLFDITQTHSCYFPVPCGKCDNCYLKKKAEKRNTDGK